MTFWLAIITNVFGLLFASIMLFSITKKLRGKRGALNVDLNLDDIVILTFMSSILAGVGVLYPIWLSMFLSIFLSGYGLLIWVDALLFIQYRIEVNRQTLAWLFKGAKGLRRGLPHLFSGLSKYPLAATVPFLWIFLVSSQSFGVIHTWLMDGSHIAVLRASSVFMSVFIVVLTLLAIIRALSHSQNQFFSTPTLILNILADDSFEADEDVAIKDEHKKFISPALEIPRPSELFGQLAGANIILITVESLGAYVQPYVKDGARSRIAERLKECTWLSKQHYCLCPNTTVSTNQMYTGSYSNNPYNKEDSLYPGSEPQHIKLLKKQGYKTLFLDSADIQLYDYHKLLSRIGFDKVWGTADMPSNGMKADYRLLNMVDEVSEQIGDLPFYLHIINDQTHMPYEVVDKQRFNRHGFSDNKSIYLNAMEEVDFILDSFLEKLDEKIDLSNTILVFTGDHGESFGEYGYSFHSNSVIKPQMQVPFMLHHPKLAAKTIEHSCHFDLFPTFLDLLGIDCPYATLGQSLAHDDRDFAYFFHSATLKGNSPANFCFMLNGEMIWMDRLFNQVNILQQGQQKLSISAQHKRYSKALLHKMLKHRGVLV